MRKKNNFLFLAGALGLCTLFAAETRAWQIPVSPASATPALQTPQEPAKPAVNDELYRIGPGDTLDISVSKQEDYSRAGVRVDNKGMIQIPRDDEELRAACKTAREVADEIKVRYRRYLRNPYVYVQVREFQSQPVAVIGAVNAPGRFQLQRRIRLLELLTMVNGPSSNASGSVQIIRTADGAMCDSPASDEAAGSGDLVAFNLKKTLEADENSNPYIRPGDIIRLPDAEQAFIVGAIKNPAGIVLREPVTLSEAIARSGGLLPEANGEKIRIVRHTPGTVSKTELVANLNAIKRRQQEDIVLQPNDIVDVPGPTGSRKFLGLLKTIVPTMTRYPIGIIP
jgi:polysaccharide export outer membrane protein